METCIYSGSLIVPDNYPCVDATASGTTILASSHSDLLSDEFLNELAVWEVTLIVWLLFIFVVLFFFKKYV